MHASYISVALFLAGSAYAVPAYIEDNSSSAVASVPSATVSTLSTLTTATSKPATTDKATGGYVHATTPASAASSKETGHSTKETGHSSKETHHTKPEASHTGSEGPKPTGEAGGECSDNKEILELLSSVLEKVGGKSGGGYHLPTIGVPEESGAKSTDAASKTKSDTKETASATVSSKGGYTHQTPPAGESSAVSSKESKTSSAVSSKETEAKTTAQEPPKITGGYVNN